MTRIITRKEWGARESGLTVYQTTWDKRSGFAVHYSAASKDQTVRAIQDHHLGKGWGDIGYNWLVDYKGNAYEGRKYTWYAVGAHIAGHNTANIGVCFIGTDADVTDEAKRTIRWLYDWGSDLAGRPLAKRYHSQLAATSCPGANLRAWVLAGMPVPQGGSMTIEERLLLLLEGGQRPPGLAQTHNGGVPVAWIHRAVWEIQTELNSQRATLDQIMARLDQLARPAVEVDASALRAVVAEVIESVRVTAQP